jgi:LysM repeat protein
MRSSVTVWQGRTGLLQMNLPIFLWAETQVAYGPRQMGGFGEPIYSQTELASTASQLKRLQRMWRPADDTEAPPVLKTSAKADLVPYVHLPWVLNDVQWGDALADPEGRRYFQAMVLVLQEYRADEELQTTRLKAGPKAKRTRTYVVRKGDTLASIAARYHLKNGWRELAASQHPAINDPRQISAGQKLIIPAS